MHRDAVVLISVMLAVVCTGCAPSTSRLRSFEYNLGIVAAPSGGALSPWFYRSPPCADLTEFANRDALGAILTVFDLHARRLGVPVRNYYTETSTCLLTSKDGNTYRFIREYGGPELAYGGESNAAGALPFDAYPGAFKVAFWARIYVAVEAGRNRYAIRLPLIWNSAFDSEYPQFRNELQEAMTTAR